MINIPGNATVMTVSAKTLQVWRGPAAAFSLGSLLASAAVAAVITTRAHYVFGLFVLIASFYALRRWPVTIWGLGLAMCVFLSEATARKVIVQAGAFSLYLSDFVPVLLLIGAAGRGRFRSMPNSWSRVAMRCGVAFLLIVMVEALRTMAVRGLTPSLQARALWPLILLVALPWMKSFSSILSRDVATVVSLGSIGLAIRTFYLLMTGTESVYAHGAQAGTTTYTVLGVQRVFQTWEPFIGAGMGLILLAYVLGARNVMRLNYVGLALSPIPVLFGFFRTSWVVFGLLGAALLFFMKGAERRSAIIGGAVAVGVVFATGALLSHKVPEYANEFQRRLAEIHLHLDTYRVQEYSAVWREIKKDVLFGQGFGTRYVGSFVDPQQTSNAHNAYEWLWWRLGLIGLVVFVVFLLCSIAGGVIAHRYLEDRDDRALAIGLVTAITFTVLVANLHENFESGQNNLFIALVFAQLSTLAALAARRRMPHAASRL